jgi:2-amino-4-hydroxy-6-hydroxymethyldihydropteridine diphosphokinase
VTEALLGLGGNVGDVQSNLAAAIALLCDGRDVHLLARSCDYRTPPWGLTDQAAFINACILVETPLEPRALLVRALCVETALGRDRRKERRWGPRTLDIDLLAYNDEVIDEPGLTLPHPRLFERAFVLLPLAEIASERIIAGVRVRDALARLDIGGIERLAPISRSD